MLSGVVLSSCVGDVGDLFPAARSEAPSAPPSDESMPAEGGIVDAAGSSTADPATDPAVDVEPDPALGEEPAAALPLDEGEPSNTSGGSGTAATEPAVGGVDATTPATPPSEAPPVRAPLDPASPSPPATSGSNARPPGVCASVADPLLLDFSSPGDSPEQAVFGDFDAVLSGGTYIYPRTSDPPGAPLPGAQPPIGQAPGSGNGPAPGGLASDVTAGDWHISGSVVEQSGFGLFLDCQLLDASSFEGIAFRISGRMGGAAGAGRVLFLVGTAENEVSSAWYLANDGTSVPSSGRCTPALSEYDGTCNQARIEIEVGAASREVFVPFSALSDGSPEPGVNPAEITTLAWALPAPALDRAGNVQPYAVDLRIDDIRFVEALPLP